jgi:tRNA A-37 threonylcarbamoyl transferase component Bud32
MRRSDPPMSLSMKTTAGNDEICDPTGFEVAQAQEPVLILTSFMKPTGFRRFRKISAVAAQVYLVLVCAFSIIPLCLIGLSSKSFGPIAFIIWLGACLPALPFLPIFDGIIDAGPDWLKLSKLGIEFSAQGIIQKIAARLTGGVLPTVRWEGLKSVSLKRTAAGGVVCLRFGERDVELNWQELSAATKQNLFLVLSRYADASSISPEITYLQMQTLSGVEANPDSFTHMWFREYESKFELSNRDALRPGALVAQRFRVIVPLSMRGPVATYLACDAAGRRVVLKEIAICANDRVDSTKQKMIEQFDREAAILSRLNHDQIVRISDHFIDNHRNYIVTDFVSGSDLRRLVNEHGPMSEADTVKVAKQLAEVLQFLHLQSPPVVHRDVSPENIMFDQQTEKVTLLDFGAANIFVTLATGTMIGKQSYMPPEQFRGKAEPKSDVYGFGATLFFLLTGEDPKPMAGFGAIDQKAVIAPLKSLIKATGSLEPNNRPTWNEITSALAACASNATAASCNARS